MIERHVVSLDLSRKLAATGFPKACVFLWVSRYNGEFWAVVAEDANEWGDFVCAAPLLSEIMESMAGCEARCHDDCDWTVGPKNASTGPDAAALLWLALKGEK